LSSSYRQRSLGDAGDETEGGPLVIVDLGLEEDEAIRRTSVLEFECEIEKVGRDQREWPDLLQEAQDHVDDLDGLGWVGPRAEFVEKNQRAGRDALEEVSQPHEFGAEPAL